MANQIISPAKCKYVALCCDCQLKLFLKWIYAAGLLVAESINDLTQTGWDYMGPCAAKRNWRLVKATDMISVSHILSSFGYE